MSSVSVWSRVVKAAVISAGSVSHSRVDSSTSASSNVTVPVGTSSLTPGSLQFITAASISPMLSSLRRSRPTNISADAQIHRARKRNWGF
jgi:hypothetical protein